MTYSKTYLTKRKADRTVMNFIWIHIYYHFPRTMRDNRKFIWNLIKRLLL